MLRLLYGRNALPHRCKIKSFLNKEIKCSRRETTIKSKKRMMQQNHEANEDLNRYTGYKMSGLCISIPTIRSTSFNSSNRNINTLQRNYYPSQGAARSRFSGYPRCPPPAALLLQHLLHPGGVPVQGIGPVDPEIGVLSVQDRREPFVGHVDDEARAGRRGGASGFLFLASAAKLLVLVFFHPLESPNVVVAGGLFVCGRGGRPGREGQRRRACTIE